MVGLGLLVVVVGYLLPVQHEATVSARVPAAPEAVWSALTDDRRSTRSGAATWTSVEMLSGRLGTRGVARAGEERRDLLRRSSRRSRRGGWSRGSRTSRCRSAGAWEYVVTGDGAGSRVRITEHGEVYNPVFRFVSRFIMGHTATASAYLKALGRAVRGGGGAARSG